MPKRLAAGDTFVVDFDPKCGCGNHATHLLAMHAVDACTPEKPTLTEFVCQTCLTRAFQLTAKLLHPCTGMNWCQTCMMSFTSLSEIIVYLVPIPKGGTDA